MHTQATRVERYSRHIMVRCRLPAAGGAGRRTVSRRREDGVTRTQAARRTPYQAQRTTLPATVGSTAERETQQGSGQTERKSTHARGRYLGSGVRRGACRPEKVLSGGQWRPAATARPRRAGRRASLGHNETRFGGRGDREKRPATSRRSYHYCRRGLASGPRPFTATGRAAHHTTAPQ